MSIEHPSVTALPAPLRGIIPPMITPLIDQDTLDVDGLERLIEHLLHEEIDGLFLLGTTGEGPSLSLAVRRALIQRACRQVAGRVPILVGVADAAPSESIRLAQHAADCGAQALVLAAPYYFPLEQAPLIEYFGDIIPKLPLPVYLYNMPTHTKISFGAALVREALQMPRVLGLKDSSPGAVCFKQVAPFVLKERPDFALLIGPEELLESSIPLGAHGGICGGANLFPGLFCQLYRSVINANYEAVRRLQAQVERLASTIYALSGPGNATIRGLKAALGSLGICSDFVASPIHQLTDDERAYVQKCLAEQLNTELAVGSLQPTAK